MALPVAALLGLAGISAAGSMGNSLIDYFGNRLLQEDSQIFTSKQNALNRNFNSAEAQKQRDFEKMMSDTSYQRGVADMVAAGINPAAVGMSSGAAVPNGAAASSNSNTSAVGGTFRATPFDNSILNSAFNKALGYDKSFANDLKRNLVHSAKEANVINKIFETGGFEKL